MKKKNLMTKTNLEKRLYEIEEQQRKEKAMERARNERNYNNYLRRKERYERQAYRQVNNQVPLTLTACKLPPWHTAGRWLTRSLATRYKNNSLSLPVHLWSDFYAHNIAPDCALSHIRSQSP